MSVGVVWSCCLVLCCGLCSGVGLCRGVVSSCVVVHHSYTTHSCTALNHTLAHTSPHYCFLTHKHSCTHKHLLPHALHSYTYFDSLTLYLTPFLFTTLLYTLFYCARTTLQLYLSTAHSLTRTYSTYTHTYPSRSLLLVDVGMRSYCVVILCDLI